VKHSSSAERTTQPTLFYLPKSIARIGYATVAFVIVVIVQAPWGEGNGDRLVTLTLPHPHGLHGFSLGSLQAVCRGGKRKGLPAEKLRSRKRLQTVFSRAHQPVTMERTASEPIAVRTEVKLVAKIGQSLQFTCCKQILTRRTQEQLRAEAKKVCWRMMKPDVWVYPACHLKGDCGFGPTEAFKE
jgi:hypothetical protein